MAWLPLRRETETGYYHIGNFSWSLLKLRIESMPIVMEQVCKHTVSKLHRYQYIIHGVPQQTSIIRGIGMQIAVVCRVYEAFEIETVGHRHSLRT